MGFRTISFVEFVQTKDKNWNTNIINCIHWHKMIFLWNSSFLKWTQMTPGWFLRSLARCIWCWFHISIGFNPLLKVNFYPHQSPIQTSGQILNRRSWVKVDGLLGINWMIKTTKSGHSSKFNNAVIFSLPTFTQKTVHYLLGPSTNIQMTVRFESRPSGLKGTIHFHPTANWPKSGRLFRMKVDGRKWNVETFENGRFFQDEPNLIFKT